MNSSRFALFLAALVDVILVASCIPGPADRVFYLWTKNDGPIPILVREVFDGNVVRGIADPVYMVPSGGLVWIEPGRSGAGPDRLEILDADCRRLQLIAEPGSGGIEMAPDLRATFRDQAFPPPRRMTVAESMNKCSDR